jgi:hypothetical protein
MYVAIRGVHCSSRILKAPLKVFYQFEYHRSKDACQDFSNKQQIQPLLATRNNVECANSNSTTHKNQLLNAGVALQCLPYRTSACVSNFVVLL